MSKKAAKELPVTCGVIVTDTRGYLICHPTMSKWWDIPKGKQDPGETLVQTAVRELQEETGVCVSEQQLSYINTFDYKPDKRLALFYLQIDNMFDVSIMSCTTTFDYKGAQFPEMDKFKIVNKKELLSAVAPAMSRVLKDVLE